MENKDLDTSRHDEVAVTYTLTIDEAAGLFADAGVPKSPRTISRNCDEGTLTCTHVDTANFWKYMINRTSVERRIDELKNVKRLPVQHDTSSYNKTHPDASGHDKLRQDASRHSSTGSDAEGGNEYVKNLEAELKGLEIDKAVRDRSIQYLEGQLATRDAREQKYIEQLIAQSRLIGDMERQLLLLDGPNGDRIIAPISPASDHRQSEIIETGRAPEVPPVDNLESERPGESVQ